MTDLDRGEDRQLFIADTSPPSFFVFVAIYALNFFRIGYQLVATAWMAVQLTNRIDAAGQVFLISTLVSFAFAPRIGKLVDSRDHKRRLLICGHLGIAFSAVLAFSGLYLTAMPNFHIPQIRYCVLILALIVITLSAILAGSAMDYFVKSYIPSSIRMQRLAFLNTVAQLALIVGTGVGGAFAAFGAGTIFLIIVTAGFGSAVLCWKLLPNLVLPIDELQQSKKIRLSESLTLYFQHPTLFAIACCAALVFSVGQITNTLLPGLIKFHLSRGSISYSTIEVAWSVGAFCVSILFAGRIRQSMGRNAQDLGVISAMAALLSAVPFLQSFGVLVALHLLLGAAFALVRIRSEVRFLTLCPLPLLGRFRANSLCLTSGIGLAVFSAPLIFGALSIPALYFLLAGMVMASVIGVLFLNRNILS